MKVNRSEVNVDDRCKTSFNHGKLIQRPLGEGYSEADGRLKKVEEGRARVVWDRSRTLGGRLRLAVRLNDEGEWEVNGRGERRGSKPDVL